MKYMLVLEVFIQTNKSNQFPQYIQICCMYYTNQSFVLWIEWKLLETLYKTSKVRIKCICWINDFEMKDKPKTEANIIWFIEIVFFFSEKTWFWMCNILRIFINFKGIFSNIVILMKLLVHSITKVFVLST